MCTYSHGLSAVDSMDTGLCIHTHRQGRAVSTLQPGSHDSSHRSYKQDLLRQTQTQAVPLVWVTVFIIDPQNNRTLQAHFSSYRGVKNWSRELSPWINKFSNLPRLFKQLLSAINKFYNGSCKAHSLSPTHTQCKYSLTLVFRTLESIKSPNHRTQST